MKNKVIFLGTLHSQHLKSADYSLQELKAIINTINPDVVLAEIPPDRFPLAIAEFKKNGSITEPRISLYPEYSKVIFLLWEKIKFDLIPVSAWTEQMANKRDKKLLKISKDLDRAKDWNAFLNAKEIVTQLFNAEGFNFSPAWIHSNRFDEILEIELAMFSKLFNNDLGEGGWENINKAHYTLIDKALHQYKNQGKTILITFGAGHKGWLKKALKQRNDIELIPLLDVL